MPGIKNKQIADDTIKKEKLNLSSPTLGKDPVTKTYFDARTINGKPLSSNVTLDKTDIGLSNVDNTLDSAKPVSTVQKTYIDTKLAQGTISQLKVINDNSITSFQVTDTGKQGLFVYDPTDSTSVNDDAMIIVSGSRRFKRRFEGFVKPEWFGAVGDGIVDDTIPVQKALTIGGNILLNKKYKITSQLSTTLNVNKDLNISGEGEIIFNGYYIALEVKSDSGLGNLDINGIKITGTMSDSLDNVLYAQGISVNGILNTSIKNSHFKNIYGDGIRIYNCKGTSEVINNTFTNVGGLNPTIDTPSGLLDHYGDGVSAVLSTNVTIENNTIINDTAARGFYGRGGIIFDNHGGGKIVNNIIRGYSRGIHVEATEQHCYILNNDVRKCPCAIITAFSGGHVIEGNYFSNEGAPNQPAVIGQYLINNYSTTSGSTFRNNIIKVDTTAGKVPTTGIQCQGDGSVYEDNIIDATIFLYGTTRHIFRKNKIKSSFIQHNFSDVIFEDNDLNVSHFEYNAGTSAKFIRNKIYNTETGGLGTIIGYNSPNFALIDNEIIDPRSFIISNGGSDSYGEISGNKLMLTESSYATPWGQYNPYFSTVPLFTKKDNYSYLAGNIVERGYYFTGKFYENGTGVVYVASVPTTGRWEVRDVAYNITPTVGQPKGWICTVAGTPGTWIPLNNIDYITPEDFGAKGDGTTDDSAAFNSAFAASTIVKISNKDYKASFTIPANKSLIGVAHSDAYLIPVGQVSRIKGTVKLSNSSKIENLNVEGSTGNGVEFIGIKATALNVGSHQNAGDGFNLTGNDANNLNMFKLDGCSAHANTGWGFKYDNATTDPNLPNCNAGTTINTSARENQSGGYYINRANDNTFVGIEAEVNVGYGIRFAQYAKGNIVLTHYEEANTLGEIILDTGSTNNVIGHPRHGSSGDGIVANNGTNNTIYGKTFDIPLVNRLQFKSFGMFDADIPGRWNFRRGTDGQFIAEVTNKNEDTNFIIQHGGSGVAGLGFQGLGGGNIKVMTSIVSLTLASIAVGTVNATSTKDHDQYFDEIRDVNWLLTFQPDLPLPSGVMWNIYYASDHYVKIRFSNITGADINVGTIAGTIKGIKIKA